MSAHTLWVSFSDLFWRFGTFFGRFWSPSGRRRSSLISFFGCNMITPPYKIAEFHLSAAAGLVLVTAGIGYIVGWAVGFIWNRSIPRGAAA
jgi:hypothetical protein